jgi:superfamily II DNA helicase RecQ
MRTTAGRWLLKGISHTVSIISYLVFGFLMRKVVITSPEILNTPDFRKEVLGDEMFRDRLTMVAVDEMHIVEQWATSYSSLVWDVSHSR